MIVERLTLKNFMRYRRRSKLDFKGKKTIGVVGPNESGKSSLLQAISYGLYGRTRATRETQLIHDHGDSDLLVQLGLRFPDGTRLEIERGRTRSNQPILVVGGFNGKPSDATQYIQEQIRLTYDDFISLSYFVQGDIHQFMKGNKRSYFKRWAHRLQVWNRYDEVIQSRITKLKAEQDQIRREMDRLSEIVSQGVLIQARASSYKLKVKDAQTEVWRFEALAEQARRAQQGTAEVGSSLDQVHEEIGPLMEELRDTLQSSEFELTQITQEVKQITKGRCPILEIHCTELETYGEVERQEKEARQRRLKQHIASTQKKITAAAARYEQAKAKAKKAYNADLKRLEARQREAQQDLKQANLRLQRLLTQYGRARDRVSQLNQAIARLGDLRNKCTSLSKNLSVLQFLGYMCGKSGIPAHILETQLGQVERRCNWVFDRLGYAKRIHFRGYKELVGYEKTCVVCGSEQWQNKHCVSCGSERQRKRRDEPNVIVKDGLIERPFELESGGAQVLQSFAVRLASSLFVSSLTGVPMHMVLLDEIFGMLDNFNRQRLMSLIIDRLSTEFGLQQQIVVSHQEDVINAVDHLVQVRVERGSSVATWG